MSKYINLSDVLVDCFKEYLGTVNEEQLHEEGFVTRKFKKFLGSKEFDKWDVLSESDWNDAWAEFNTMTK
ncbi:hypothetical protein BSK59_13950 [Paenibacillus odorifer]|uniref:hypothetical protein n=1 Tax=Paenibacillus odorifer TaxID=189426 RepID=UPI00096DACCD|nr:hypothetical protein [Paenibacillus odorifer]OME55573.1 hypothetical protein BSK59_13950 [Paenibacillus odorifer]